MADTDRDHTGTAEQILRLRADEGASFVLRIVLEPVAPNGAGQSDRRPSDTMPTTWVGSAGGGTGGVGGTGAGSPGGSAGSHGSVTAPPPVPEIPAGVRWDIVEQQARLLNVKAPSHVGRAPVWSLEGYEWVLELAVEGANVRGLL